MTLKILKSGFIAALNLSNRFSKMSSLKREEIICLFDVDGTLTMPRQVNFY